MSAAQVLGGRYELGERIGQGGMATVFRGVDARLGRDVAVKVLRQDLSQEPAFRSRFRREAQAAASLNAPTIVSVFDTGEDDDGIPYIVMEHVAGRTLREVLHAEGRLLPQRALEVAADVCSALDTAHRAGIVHRDIKPANVMLDRSGNVKVMDFGIARAAADSSSAETQTAAVLGTAAYLSPEQALGQQVDTRSDLYSTGCLLYELVTGEPPFTGDTPVLVMHQHLVGTPELPSAFDPALDPSVDAVVLKAMAKNPDNRYQSAREMRADLLRASVGEPVLATPVLVEVAPGTTSSTTTTTLRPIGDGRRGRGLAYGLFAVLLLGLVLGVALLVRGLLGVELGSVQAPALVGLDQRQAAVVLAEQGLRPGRVTDTFVPDGPEAAPFGTVLRQTPDQGVLVASDGAVDLLISRGVEQAVVPTEVVGISRDEAVVLLEQRKLPVSEQVGRDGNFPPGTVLAVEPPPGTQVTAGTPVTLIVATGQVQVPDVRGRTRDEAIAELQQAGFSVGVQPREADAEQGRVVDQSPVGALAARGSAVVIAVAIPVPPPPPSPAPSSAPAPPPVVPPSPTA